jgi:hypothetical protein
MAGLFPVIHVFAWGRDVDTRHVPGMTVCCCSHLQNENPDGAFAPSGFSFCTILLVAQATRLMASLRIVIMSSIWFFSTVSGGDIAKASPLWRR